MKAKKEGGTAHSENVQERRKRIKRGTPDDVAPPGRVKIVLNRR
ncbi:hypothetical protein HMPREF0208_01528 [Citrobacter koseri]|nr:hypothetical protein HMPREF3220_04105 [Citrobacter koseri]KXA05363.1 hypothetical protein HMPREF3207_00845 [Citrobacter koseri]KXB44964.1 hypothetical protein HMPREF0208_01528 [Citrobacter koseri]